MEQEKKLYTLLVFSENFAGLLNQVTAVFTRRQVNIECIGQQYQGRTQIHHHLLEHRRAD